MVIFISSATPASSKQNDFNETVIQVTKYGYGYFYTEINDEFKICIAAEPGHDIEFNIAYTDNPKLIYQQYIPYENVNLKAGGFASADFWTSAKEIAVNTLQNSKTISFSLELHEAPFTPYNLVIPALKDDLRSIYGSEYSNRVIAFSWAYLPLRARVTEFLDFDVYLTRRLTWTQAMTIAAFVVGCPFVFEAGAAAAIAWVLGFSSIYEIVSPGTSVDWYICVAIFRRYGCINEVAYIPATRSDVYDAFEAAARIKMCSTCDKIYAPSQYYYEDDSYLMRAAVFCKYFFPVYANSACSGPPGNFTRNLSSRNS